MSRGKAIEGDRYRASGTGSETLETSEVRVYFEGVRALDGVDFVLDQSEVLGLIGPNGAGKTTLINVLSGYQRPTSGTVTISGREATGWSPARLAGVGVARTFQNARLFPSLTVFENVEVGAVGVGSRRGEARRLATEILERFHLNARASSLASALSHGDERRVGIARALATRPRFLLLDEPAAGLNEEESSELVNMLIALQRDSPLGMLVIEHDMRVIMTMCQRIQVLDYGKTIAVGSPTEIRHHPAVLEAYLGT